METRRPMTPEQTTVWGILQGQRGRARAVKQAVLAVACGVSVRTLQQVLKALTEEHHKSIVSSCRPPYGVFVPVTQEEKDEYMAQLKARAVSCFRRLDAISSASAQALHREVQQALWDDARKAS